MICDFHSHALFGIDDGAKDKQMAVAMLKKAKSDGVDTVLLTSHCYPENYEDIDRFIEKRDRICDELACIEGLPNLVKACEVHITRDIARFRNIRKLCIEDTNYMLVEMPHAPWTDKTIDTVYKLNIRGITPIIAHDERNMHQRPELHNALYDLDVLIQINAPSLFKFSDRKKIDKLMRRGLVHVIGTDMHNTTTREPCMEKARKRIIKRYGEECWHYLMRNSEKILNGEEVTYRDFRSFKKKGIF